MVNVEIEELEKKKQELKRDNGELKEKVERLLREIKEMRSLEAAMKQRLEEMEVEIEQFKEEKKVLESVSTRAVELEIEIITIQGDLVSSLRGGNETAKEVTELKKGLVDKCEKFEILEEEVESLRKVRSEIEKRVRDLERRIGVLDVKEMEEKSKRVRVEEVMREKCNQRDGEIKELERKVSELKQELVKDVGTLENCKCEKKCVEEALSESEIKEMEMELKKEVLFKKAEEAKKTIAVLNERILEPSNGVRTTSDGDQKSFFDGELQWTVVAAGSVGIAGLVAGTLFVCYSKRM